MEQDTRSIIEVPIHRYILEALDEIYWPNSSAEEELKRHLQRMINDKIPEEERAFLSDMIKGDKAGKEIRRQLAQYRFTTVRVTEGRQTQILDICRERCDQDPENDWDPVRVAMTAAAIHERKRHTDRLLDDLKDAYKPVYTKLLNQEWYRMRCEHVHSDDNQVVAVDIDYDSNAYAYLLPDKPWMRCPLDTAMDAAAEIDSINWPLEYAQEHFYNAIGFSQTPVYADGAQAPDAAPAELSQI